MTSLEMGHVWHQGQILKQIGRYQLGDGTKYQDYMLYTNIKAPGLVVTEKRFLCSLNIILYKTEAPRGGGLCSLDS